MKTLLFFSFLVLGFGLTQNKLILFSKKLIEPQKIVSYTNSQNKQVNCYNSWAGIHCY